MDQAERKALIFLYELEEVGWETINALITHLDRLESISHYDAESLSHVTGITPRKASIIVKNWPRRLEQDIEAGHAKIGVSITTLWDKDFPELLKQTVRAPWLLYYRGDLSKALSQPVVAIVGTRVPTHYGKSVARKIAKQAAHFGWTVVSGLARGIDSEAHRGALEVDGGLTIAVMGSGLNHVYPRENLHLAAEIERSGLLLSEFKPDTPAKAGLFPIRNRIIAGVALATVVVEAAFESGSLITAELALNESREVFAIPGPITSPKSQGPLQLIYDGSKMIRGFEDLLEEFPRLSMNRPNPIQTGNGNAPKLDWKEEKLWQLIEMEPIHLDHLLSLGIFSLAEIHTLLLSLQMKKLIKQLPGSRYVRVYE